VPIFLTATTSDTSSTPLSGVSGFFSSGTFAAVERIGIVFLIALWLALAVWTWKDSRRRIADDVIVWVCTLTAVLFGPLGVLVYIILRPPEYLADVHERELEIRAMERRLGADQVCPYCRNATEPGFLSCPHCGTKLKEACRRCKSPLDPEWRLCPYCETAVPSSPLEAPPVVSSRSSRDPVTQRSTYEA
jgi:RNA polymerase subunit RPABC4/transcription elongation factor Spt4